MLATRGLSGSRKAPPRQGAARYLAYPEHTVYHGLGERVVEEADFIARKYLTGRTEPLHFVGFCGKRAPKLRYFQRVEAETTEAFLTACERFFERFEVPEVMKVDNCAAIVGSGQYLGETLCVAFYGLIAPASDPPGLLGVPQTVLPGLDRRQQFRLCAQVLEHTNLYLTAPG